MKPDALLCTVGTSMFGRMPELRQLAPDTAAARLLGLMPRAAAARILAARSGRNLVKSGLVRREPEGFCQDGRALAGEHSGRCGGPSGHFPAIDATGGYKPQIAYAALVGQVMQIPVYYRYEGFAEVIALQPLPVAVDAQVWFDHLWFFERLREDLLPDREISAHDPRVAPLIEREDHLVMLSPLGELMAAAADGLLAARGADVLPPDCGTPPDRKKVVYEDGNNGKHAGLAGFCERIARAPYVTRLSTYYYNPDLPKKSAVRLPAERQDPPDLLDVWYGDGSAVTKLNVWTTSQDNRQLAAAAADLRTRLETEN
jgi:hypothetical protein